MRWYRRGSGRRGEGRGLVILRSPVLSFERGIQIAYNIITRI